MFGVPCYNTRLMTDLRRILNGPIEENCWLASSGGRGVLIDPGSEPGRILAEIKAMGLKVEWILATHAHFDHVGAVAPLQEALKAPFAMHEADLGVLDA